jgi:glycosyltransferase involved in cell wall biosynthesis
VKLLYLTPQPPFPPDQGAKLRNFHLIRLAAQAGHQVDLLTFGPSAELRDSVVAGLTPWCRQVLGVSTPKPRPLVTRALSMLGSAEPDLARRLRSAEFSARLVELLANERYDIVQVEGIELAPYLDAIRPARTVFDDHNVEYLLQRRAWQADRQRPRRVHAALYSFVQAGRLRRWEKLICRSVDAVVAVSELDAQALSRLSGRPVAVVPNGIDLSAVAFRDPTDSVDPNLLFDGTMSFRPNTDAASWLCGEIVPRLRATRPEIRCWIVGRDPAPALVAQNFGPNGVAVTGEVVSTTPYWERAAIYVLPMRMGSGVRFKALEAMARGLPLVSTALGVEGTGARPDHDYLRAETTAQFCQAIGRLLDDQALRQRLAANARKCVTALDWTAIGPRYLAVLERLLA